MSTTKRVFVTGGHGFLGSHLVRRLKNLGCDVVAPTSKECDLRNYSQLSELTKGEFEQIFHLAAWTQAGDFCLYHPGEQWIVNQELNTNLLKWWHEQQPQAKLVAIGSSCCYEPGTPHVEENFLSGVPIASLFTYAQTKRMLLTGLLALAKQYNHRFLFVVPSTLYGSDYHLDGRQMHFIFDLMRKIVDGKYLGTPVTLWGDGSQRRELIKVDDFVTAMLALNEKVDNEVVNIGGGEEFPIRSFAEILSRYIGFNPASIEYDTTKYVGATSKVLVIDKLKQLLPEFRHSSLESGLEQTVLWYLEARELG